jgi:predicted ABC-type ATPase
MPALYIISGPNGSGKTTLADIYSLFLGDTANG